MSGERPGEAAAVEAQARKFIETLRPIREDVIATAIGGMAETDCDIAAGDTYDETDYVQHATSAADSVVEHIAWSSALTDFAEAVRTEERERIAQAYREHFYSRRADGEPTHWHQGCSGCLEWMRRLRLGIPVRVPSYPSLRAALRAVEKVCDDQAEYCGSNGLDTPSWVGTVRAALGASL